MGTYTTNYNLFMPTIGEQGWGDLVNGNFSTIDTTMKGLDTRVVTLEPLLIIQVDENQNVTFPGNVTVNGSFSGVVDYIQLNGYVTTTVTDLVYATGNDEQSLSETSSPATLTVSYSYNYASLPISINEGIYIVNVQDDVTPTSRTLSVYNGSSYSGAYKLYLKKSGESTYTEYAPSSKSTINVNLEIGETYQYYTYRNPNISFSASTKINVSPTLYLTTKTP